MRVIIKTTGSFLGPILEENLDKILLSLNGVSTLRILRRRDWTVANRASHQLVETKNKQNRYMYHRHENVACTVYLDLVQLNIKYHTSSFVASVPKLMSESNSIMIKIGPVQRIFY